MPSSSDIIVFFQNYYEIWGYKIVFIGALLENVFPIGYFVPGSTLLWLGSFYSHDGGLSFLSVLKAGIIGSFLGHNIDYIMGRTGWYRIFKRFIAEENFKKARRYFVRGRIFEAIIVYFIGYTRSLLIISIGVLKIDYLKFGAFALLTATLWNIGFGLFGYFIGGQRQYLERGLDIFWLFGFMILAIYLITKLISHRINSKKMF